MANYNYKQGEYIGMKELFRFYCQYGGPANMKLTEEDRIKRKHRYQVDTGTFSRVINSFNAEIARMIVEECLDFKMPANLGRARIRKYKKKIRLKEDDTIDTRNMPVDWNTTLQMWAKQYPGKTREELKQIRGKQVVYFLNEHTNGYVFTLYWDRKGVAINNKNVYSLHLTKTNKKMIGNAVKTNPDINYYE